MALASPGCRPGPSCRHRSRSARCPVVQQHQETDLALAGDHDGDAHGVPADVERAFQNDLQRGILAYGLAPVPAAPDHSDSGRHDFRVAFPSKGAGCARPATPGARQRRRRIGSSTASRRSRCARGQIVNKALGAQTAALHHGFVTMVLVNADRAPGPRAPTVRPERSHGKSENLLQIHAGSGGPAGQTDPARAQAAQMDRARAGGPGGNLAGDAPKYRNGRPAVAIGLVFEVAALAGVPLFDGERGAAPPRAISEGFVRQPILRAKATTERPANRFMLSRRRSARQMP